MTNTKQAIKDAKLVIATVKTALRVSERAFEKTAKELQNALLTVPDQFRGEAWETLYYSHPNPKQLKTFNARCVAFIAAERGVHAATVLTYKTALEMHAFDVLKDRAALTNAKSVLAAAVKADRDYKGDESLIAALALPRVEYRNRVLESIKRDVDNITARLDAVNMNMETAFPLVARRGDSREAVRRTVEARRYADKFFQPGPGGTARVQMREDIRDIIANLSDKLTEEHFGGYILKLSAKIGKDVSCAKLVGSLWHDSTLHVLTVDGEEQRWSTQCIWNQSVLGKVFNQWPTRRLS